MSGQRQPLALIEAKGKKHLTKAEIEDRQNTEIRAPANRVTAPKYLTKEQQMEFKKIVKELKEIDLVANLDIDALARLIIAQENYIRITKILENIDIMKEGEVNKEADKLMVMQDRYFKQCRQGASDFGLTVSSRCKLVVPKPKTEAKPNKFTKFA